MGTRGEREFELIYRRLRHRCTIFEGDCCSKILWVITIKRLHKECLGHRDDLGSGGELDRGRGRSVGGVDCEDYLQVILSGLPAFRDAPCYASRCELVRRMSESYLTVWWYRGLTLYNTSLEASPAMRQPTGADLRLSVEALVTAVQVVLLPNKASYVLPLEEVGKLAVTVTLSGW